MLERRAASLESCSLQRIIHPTNFPHSIRRLQSWFWRHAGNEVELYNACQCLLRARPGGLSSPFPPNSPASRADSPHATVTASLSVFQALHPPAAPLVARRCFPKDLTPSERQSRLRGNPVPRRYSSDSKGAIQVPADAQDEKEDETMVDEHESQENGRLPQPEPSRDDLGLQRLLDSGQKAMYEQVWLVFRALDPGRQEKVRSKVIKYLAVSNRLVEACRILDLFAAHPEDAWQAELVSAAIRANLINNDFAAALSIFSRGLDRYGWCQGLDSLLAYALQTCQWDQWIRTCEAFDNWAVFQHWKLKRHVRTQPQTAIAAAPADARPEPKRIFPGLVFGQLSKVPEFAAKLAQFRLLLDEQENRETAVRLDDKTRWLLTLVADRCLHLFSLQNAVVVAEHAKDPAVYESLMALCMGRKEFALAASLYRNYRQLPNVRMDPRVWKWMRQVFYPYDVRGMEELRHDIYAHYPRTRRLPFPFYRSYMAFYAGRGDTEALQQVMDEYAKHFPEQAAQDPRLHQNRIHVHARRGEAELVQQLVRDSVELKRKRWLQGRWKPDSRIRSIDDVVPHIKDWNILLDAYVKADDYGQAIATFGEMSESGRVDKVSFGTIMHMVGARGDLALALELYKMAGEMDISPSMHMVDAVVEAYCQNDRYHQAEQICTTMTQNKTLKQAKATDYTYIWNTLLACHARRRDLVAVNRLLTSMAQHHVPFNDETYNNLFQALVNCRQSHHAYSLLRVAEQDKVFTPTLSHHLLVMAAFIRTREPHMALLVNKSHIQDKAKLPKTTARWTKVLEALTKWRRMPRVRRGLRGAEHYVVEAARVFRASLGRRQRRTVADDANSAGRQYALMIFFLTQLRDFTSVNRLTRLYKALWPDRASGEQVPVKLVNSLMLADLYDKQAGRVKSSWRMLYARVTEQSRQAGTDQISPSYRFALTEPLKTMLRLHLALNDAKGLKALVAQVQERGFELDSKNWNYYVQALARMKDWREAFSVCEKELMPQWEGWFNVRQREGLKAALPLQLRRLGSHYGYRRPSTHTLLVLAREYMDLEQLAPWSGDVARAHIFVQKECPRVVNAINTMIRTKSRLERNIFGATGPKVDDPAGLRPVFRTNGRPMRLPGQDPCPDLIRLSLDEEINGSDEAASEERDAMGWSHQEGDDDAASLPREYHLEPRQKTHVAHMFESILSGSLRAPDKPQDRRQELSKTERNFSWRMATFFYNLRHSTKRSRTMPEERTKMHRRPQEHKHLESDTTAHQDKARAATPDVTHRKTPRRIHKKRAGVLAQARGGLTWKDSRKSLMRWAKQQKMLRGAPQTERGNASATHT